MKRPNKKRLLKGLPLRYDTIQKNVAYIPYSYICKELNNKVITIYGKMATQHNLKTFKDNFVKLTKEQGYNINFAAEMAKDNIYESGMTVEKYKKRLDNKNKIIKEKRRKKLLSKVVMSNKNNIKRKAS
jgi:hypothetical protein